MTVFRNVLRIAVAMGMAMTVASCVSETTTSVSGTAVTHDIGVSEARSIVRHSVLSLPGCLAEKGLAIVDLKPTVVHLTNTSLTVDFSDSSSRGPYVLKDITPSVSLVIVGIETELNETKVNVLSGNQAANSSTPRALCEIRGDHTNEPALQHLIDALVVLKQAAADPALAHDDDAHFAEVVSAYKAKTTKPQLPEDARRFRVQAEAAINDNDFGKAADYYGKALEVAPWWPEGHFDRAMMLAETDDFADATTEMKRYLLLVPNASDARASQDKIYEWERKAPAGN